MFIAVPSFVSDHKRMKSEFSNKRKTGKFTVMWKLDSTQTDVRSKKKQQETLENSMRQMKAKYTEV
jgi:hypothetical protein